MCPVWKPAADPPHLSKYCYLSSDAQVIMAAFYQEYNARKQAILQSQRDRCADVMNYYQKMYQTRFGKAAVRRPLKQYSSRIPSDNTSNPFDQIVSGNHCGIISPISMNTETDIEPQGDETSLDETLETNFSDSPPIETQDYRKLSQFCKSQMAEVKKQQEQEDIIEEAMIPSSPILFSQDDHGPLQGGSTVLCRDVDSRCCMQDGGNKFNKHSVVQERELETVINRTAKSDYLRKGIGTDSHDMHSVDQGLWTESVCTVNQNAGNIEEDIEFDSLRLRSKLDLICQMDITDDKLKVKNMGSTVNIEKPRFQDGMTKSIPAQQSISYSGMKTASDSRSKGESNKKSLKQSKLVYAEDALHLALEKSTLNSNRQCSIGKKLEEHKKLRHTFSERQIDTVDEVSASVEDPLHHKDKKKRTHFKATSSFSAPFKKARTDAPNHIEHQLGSITIQERADCPSVNRLTDISDLSKQARQEIYQTILNSSEVMITVLYSDGSTSLRDQYSIQDKKKQNMRLFGQEIDGIAVLGINSLNQTFSTVYLFPFDESDSADLEIEFWKMLLKSDMRKICYQSKELFLSLLRQHKSLMNAEPNNWTVLDPEIAVWLLDPDSPPKSFQHVLSSVYLSMQENDVQGVSRSLICADLLLLSTAMGRLFQKLQNKELWDLYVCVETKLTLVLAIMEMTDICVNTNTLLSFSDILKKKLAKLEQKAHEAAGHSFLLNSHPQLRQVLFEELRLESKLPQKTKLAKTSVGHLTSTSEAVLSQLVDYHPLPGLVLEYRQLQKLKSTYVDGILSCVTGDKLWTHWDQTSAATGRLTAYQPNVQAIPKVPVTISGFRDNFIAGREISDEVEIYARDPFVSHEGWSLLAADFQQIELRLLAHLSDDPVLLKVFSDDDIPDIFNELTSQWLGKPVSEVTNSEREQTKRIVYSIMYGAGKEKLSEYLKISADNAKAIMTSFLVKFPAVSQFTKTCVEFCKQNGYTQTIFKRRRMFQNIRHPSPPLRAQAERQAVNFCVQGSAADLCKAAMLQVVNTLKESPEVKARLLLQIHDELLLEVADEDLTQVKGLMKEVMENRETLCGSVVKLKVPVKVSLSIGKTWGHMEPAD